MNGQSERAVGVSAIQVERVHPSVDLAGVGHRWPELHDQVCGRGQRFEVTRDGCDDVCVLISKRELEAMESALTLFAKCDSHGETCRKITALLAEAGMVYAPRAHAHGESVPTFADDCSAA